MAADAASSSRVLPSVLSSLLSRGPRPAERRRLAVSPGLAVPDADAPDVLSLHPNDVFPVYTACLWTVDRPVDADVFSRAVSLALSLGAYRFACGRWHSSCSDDGHGYGLVAGGTWVPVPISVAELSAPGFGVEDVRAFPEAFLEPTPPFTPPPGPYDPKLAEAGRPLPPPLVTFKLTTVLRGTKPAVGVVGGYFSHVLFDGASVFAFAALIGTIMGKLAQKLDVDQILKELPAPSAARPAPPKNIGPPPAPANDLLSLAVKPTYAVYRFASQLAFNHLGLGIDRVELVFTDAELAKLKAEASSGSDADSGAWISTHDALVGHLLRVGRRAVAKANSDIARRETIAQKLVRLLLAGIGYIADKLACYSAEPVSFDAAVPLPDRIVTITDVRGSLPPEPYLSPFTNDYVGNATVPSVSRTLPADPIAPPLRALALLSRESIAAAPQAFATSFLGLYALQRSTTRFPTALVPRPPRTDMAADSWAKMRAGILDPGFGRVVGFASVPESPPFPWAAIVFPARGGLRVVMAVPKRLGVAGEVCAIVERDRMR
ncbi:hypothetical protein DFJ74DRAFT_709367 [Hyaloraphidium curvatum]|nr:hypothetical protein DFJ74DRAFT_709367 [Hyaloraphidium curvatum]